MAEASQGVDEGGDEQGLTGAGWTYDAENAEGTPTRALWGVLPRKWGRGIRP